MRRASPGGFTIPIPEGVELTFVTAGPATRFFAWFIDLLAVVAILSVAQRFLSIASIFGADWRVAVLTIAYFLISTGYAICMEWSWSGQTVGKRLCSIKVIDANGLHLTLAQVVIRNLLRVVDVLPAAYLAGGVASFFNSNHMRLGDMAANTAVVRIATVHLSNKNVATTKYNSLAAYPHLIARIRHQAARELIEISQGALARRDRLNPADRLTLFHQIRSRFEAIARFPESATDYLADEQYVRNIIAALFERKKL